MADELQHLIERIQKEAIDKAEGEAERIVSGAKEKAAAEIKAAEQKAADLLRQAEKDAEAYAERSRRTLEQAARDLLITVGQGVENILSEIVDHATDEALDENGLRDLIGRVVEAYIQKDGAESRIEVLVGEKDREALVEFFTGRYRKELEGGVELREDREILKGFRVAVKDRNVEHDFTREAIAEALSNFLRPHLSEIVHRAARGAAENGSNTEPKQDADS